MRILYLYQYFGTPKGGWSTRVYEMARRWVDQGHEVRVITSIYDKSDLEGRGFLSKQVFEGIQVYVLNLKISNKHSFLYRIYTFLAFAIATSSLVLFTRYDAVVASSGPISVGVPALVARYLRRKPMIFEVRDLWPEGAIQLGLVRSPVVRSLSYWFEKQCYRGAQEIVALSPGMAASIEGRLGLTNIHVIPNACDVKLFSLRSHQLPIPTWAQDKHLILYTGSLGLMDDCMQIIKAAALLRQRADIMIVILGEGQERGMMESFVKDHSLTNVKFLGLRPKEEVILWLNRALATLLVFKDIPVLGTSSPNKMFDSFAAGKPIIQTTRGWIKQMVTREQCGINVPPNEPEEMAAAIAYLADNPQMAQSLGKNALRLATNDFNRDHLSKKMLDILIKYQ